MRIIVPGNAPPPRVTCRRCGAELEIGREDVRVADYGQGFVRCPCCLDDIIAGPVQLPPHVLAAINNVRKALNAYAGTSNEEMRKHILDAEIASVEARGGRAEYDRTMSDGKNVLISLQAAVEALKNVLPTLRFQEQRDEVERVWGRILSG